MPSSTETPRAPSANKKRLEALVAQRMKVLEKPPTPSPTDQPSALERDAVRSRLRLNREHGLLDLTLIRPDPAQPRATVDTDGEEFKGLVASIKTHGVLQPIRVRYVEDGDYFQLISGERRYRAAKAAGLREIPAVVQDVDDNTKAIQQLVENLQRQDLNPVEEARAFRFYMAATHESQEQLAKRIGKSPAYVSQILAIDDRLTKEEKARLEQISPAKLPGKSIIYEALQAPDQKTRSAILFGGLKRAEARQATSAAKGKPVGGRPRTYSRAFDLEQLGASVTVRFTKKKNASREDVLEALDAARAEIKRELR
jgi:ParB/RepB/Spo0J family partition protein